MPAKKKQNDMYTQDEILIWIDKAIESMKEGLNEKHFRTSVEVLNYLRSKGISESILWNVKNILIEHY